MATPGLRRARVRLHQAGAQQRSASRSSDMLEQVSSPRRVQMQRRANETRCVDGRDHASGSQYPLRTAKLRADPRRAQAQPGNERGARPDPSDLGEPHRFRHAARAPLLHAADDRSAAAEAHGAGHGVRRRRGGDWRGGHGLPAGAACVRPVALGVRCPCGIHLRARCRPARRNASGDWLRRGRAL